MLRFINSSPSSIPPSSFYSQLLSLHHQRLTLTRQIYHQFSTSTSTQSQSQSPSFSSSIDQSQKRRRSISPNDIQSRDPYVLYLNPRRFQSFGLTCLAGGQAAFWGYATFLSHQLSTSTTIDTDAMVIGMEWTIGGFGLSAIFAWMVSAYLQRLVARVDLLNVNGPVIRVTPHSFAGRLGYPVDIRADEIVAGPMKDKKDSRHWTFGLRKNKNSAGASGGGRPFYYILDMKTYKGIHDKQGLAAIVNGPEHFIAWSYKRDAEFMKQRWKKWRQNADGNSYKNGQNTNRDAK